LVEAIPITSAAFQYLALVMLKAPALTLRFCLKA